MVSKHILLLILFLNYMRTSFGRPQEPPALPELFKKWKESRGQPLSQIEILENPESAKVATETYKETPIKKGSSWDDAEKLPYDPFGEEIVDRSPAIVSTEDGKKVTFEKLASHAITSYIQGPDPPINENRTRDERKSIKSVTKKEFAATPKYGKDLEQSLDSIIKTLLEHEDPSRYPQIQEKIPKKDPYVIWNAAPHHLAQSIEQLVDEEPNPMPSSLYPLGLWTSTQKKILNPRNVTSLPIKRKIEFKRGDWTMYWDIKYDWGIPFAVMAGISGFFLAIFSYFTYQKIRPVKIAKHQRDETPLLARLFFKN